MGFRRWIILNDPQWCDTYKSRHLLLQTFPKERHILSSYQRIVYNHIREHRRSGMQYKLREYRIDIDVLMHG